MKPALRIRTLTRRLLLAGITTTAAGVSAQVPAAGTGGNPTAPLDCWHVVPAAACPPGPPCTGSGGGLGMSQKRGDALPPGLVAGGAFAPLLYGPTGTSMRMINNNLAVADLRMLAPLALNGIQVNRVISTIYRGSMLYDTVGQQLQISFASGSLPAVSQVAQFPLSPSVQGGNWLLALDVQGRIVPREPAAPAVAASFRIACTLPVIVQQRLILGQ
ncbi:hypothetical protein LNV09_22200 [Paucibacter sp. B2R-40]|uniref:hypothetical protein n=1 Tax=Paucibacter sp. B2R-40 TaxID=2893554 RepID=UPI0021E3942E|nr:hypothetical protein [Paucibacter sp. B2R-40]MCV2356863.1 hypothetical protein [Paucibacter sp. B2R-40]